MKPYITTILTIILIYLIITYMSHRLSKKKLFTPTKITYNDMKNIKHIFKDKIELGIIRGDETLWFALYNKYRKPLWSDNITFYCHGNSGWIGSVLNDPYIEEFSKHGSVFIFDYRGYGMSTGEPTEHGVYTDAINAWRFMVDVKGVDINNVIMFGHSLGSSIVSYMASFLYKNNEALPKYLILSSPFYNLRYIYTDFYPLLGRLNHNKFETNKYLKVLNGAINVIYIHSKDDEIVNIYHSHKLRSEMNGQLFIVNGSHSNLILTDDARKGLYDVSMTLG